MFASIVEIEVHLAGVGVGELADLQIDDDEAAQFAVKEKEIDAIPFPADPQPALAADESKIASQLEAGRFPKCRRSASSRSLSDRTVF